MKTIAALWAFGLLGTATSLALAKPYYIALGMSSTALLVALASATYVFVKVTRAGGQEARIGAVEAAADELDRHLGH